MGHFNQYMQVTKKPAPGKSIGEVYADGKIFAVGDCNYGCIGDPSNWVMPPIPKISYPGEEQALHAVTNLERIAKGKKKLAPTWWPWELECSPQVLAHTMLVSSWPPMRIKALAIW